MGWEIEQHQELIKKLQAQGLLPAEEVAEVDGKLVFRTAAAIRDPEAALSSRHHPVRGRMLFQVVAETKSVKNRVHLDIYFDAEDRDAEVERLISLGATKLWDGRQGQHTWVTLADPEGNEFCVA